MRQSIEAWKSHGQGGSSIWERISQYKAPVVEPSDASSFPTAALEFKKQLDSPAQSGAVFFGVCRGKASEGLDFSDRAGRAVVITGIPFAMMTDPKVRLKKEVMDTNVRNARMRQPLDNNKNDHAEPLSGDMWYVQQAMRAVNQAIGRVIRHKNDYGAIILCDERFGSQVRMQTIHAHINL
jgi:regulator of telomere elongation helicase 1